MPGVADDGQAGRSKRIEPRIGRIDLTVDPADRQRARSAARTRRFHRELLNWLVVLGLFILLTGGCVVAAVFLGALHYPDDFQWTDFPGKLIVGGILLGYVAQIVGALLAFRIGFAAGGLSLLVPGYVFFCLRREEVLWPVVAVWLLGAALVTVGLFLLS